MLPILWELFLSKEVSRSSLNQFLQSHFSWLSCLVSIIPGQTVTGHHVLNESDSFQNSAKTVVGFSAKVLGRTRSLELGSWQVKRMTRRTSSLSLLAVQLVGIALKRCSLSYQYLTSVPSCKPSSPITFSAPSRSLSPQCCWWRKLGFMHRRQAVYQLSYDTRGPLPPQSWCSIIVFLIFPLLGLGFLERNTRS